MNIKWLYNWLYGEDTFVVDTCPNCSKKVILSYPTTKC